MNARQQQILVRFNQVLAFLDANADTIPAALVAQQRQILATAVAQIMSFTQAQLVRGANMPASQSVASARTAVRDTYLRQLSTIGLECLTGKNPGDPSVPNAVQIFAMPVTRTNSQTIVASATAMLSVATQYPAIFATAGVNLDTVSAAIEALQAAMIARGSANRVSQGATQGIKAQIRAGKGAVRIMDVIIRPVLAATPDLVREWQTVKRSAGGPKFRSPAPHAAAPGSQSADAPAAPAGPVTTVPSGG